ncbi:MAG TPA: hypothetical protein VEJ18_05150, partial [Planctomycetota bacterium]|nr:hypothetical protein [Planctomycetota bacterium]
MDAEGERALVTWVSKSTEEDGAGTRVLRLDAALRPLEPPLRVHGEAGGALLQGEDLTLFFGTRYQVVRGGNSVRGADLGQTWAVRAAVRDAARGADWIFGWHDGRIVARRRELGTFSETLDVAPSGVPERVFAAVDGPQGPLVAWRETASDVVRAALYDGRAFVPRAPVRLPHVDEWTAALADGRILLVTYDRDDRSFRAVGLRVRCCADCPSPLPEAQARFADPVLFLGKAVEGLAAARAGDRLAVAVARTSTLQMAAFRLPDLRAAPDRLEAAAAEPR